jgi:small-conductance mechanosensitive channel
MDFSEWIRPLEHWPIARAVLILAVSVLLSAFADLINRKVLNRLAGATETDLDDQIVDTLRAPMVLSFLNIGVWLALKDYGVSEGGLRGARGALVMFAVMYWSGALIRISRLVLRTLATRSQGLVRPRSLPFFDMLAKVFLVGTSVYFVMVGWGINLTAWLASAGIVGMVVALAAQDTLSNFFAGVFIMVDAPYRIGDFLTLEDGTQGLVTDIGIRTTRMITLDDAEIIIPNSEIANARLINESGGPNRYLRLRVPVGVGYGADAAQVKALLLAIAGDIEELCDGPEQTPQVRFREFGASSLDFDLLVWVRRPEHRAEIIDQLNMGIYQRFSEAGIEIPFPKRDIYHYRGDIEPPTAGSGSDG